MRPVSDVLEEAGRFFMGDSPLHRSATRLGQALDELGIPFAVAGAFAVGAHGHTRATEDIDVLLTPEGLERFKERWLGRGWTERFAGSKGLRDAVHGVTIDVLCSGDFPGDGKPKPVAFPRPDEPGAVVPGDLPVLTLPKLVELKIASGLTAPHRLQDLADVIALIRVNRLAREWGERLDPYVRAKYAELWDAAQGAEDEPG